jgi:hypothetical protein
MAYAQHRSYNQSLDEGATDGSYFKERPNIEDPQGANTAKTQADRRSLLALNGYSAAVLPNPPNPGK